MGLVSCCGPMCLGHESAGIIVQLGSNLTSQAEALKESQKAVGGDRGKANAVTGKPTLMLGDKVALEPGVTCRMCPDCRGGRYNVSRALQKSARVELTG